jgi:hypothetical protein
LTQRAKAWLTRRVGADADTVAALARELGLGWATVMRAVMEVGRRLIDDPHRLDGVSALGVDEHAWQRANAARSTQFATGIVHLSGGRPARLLDVVAGRSGAVYGDWIAKQPADWREATGAQHAPPARGVLDRLAHRRRRTSRDRRPTGIGVEPGPGRLYPRTGHGRQVVAAEVVELVVGMARENPRWAT